MKTTFRINGVRCSIADYLRLKEDIRKGIIKAKIDHYIEVFQAGQIQMKMEVYNFVTE